MVSFFHIYEARGACKDDGLEEMRPVTDLGEPHDTKMEPQTEWKCDQCAVCPFTCFKLVITKKSCFNLHIRKM